MATTELHPTPFPHIVVENWWDEELLHAVVAEFPPASSNQWHRFENEHEVKLGAPARIWGPATDSLLEAMAAKAGELEDLFGIPELSMELAGGGMHLIPPGGHLDVHTDFNRSLDTGLYRRLNMLVYLNPGWDDEGGHLVMQDVGRPTDPDHPVSTRTIEPEFNRTVVFETSDHSWHGHPTPARRTRRSIASYFFSPQPPKGYTGDHSTVWAER